MPPASSGDDRRRRRERRGTESDPGAENIDGDSSFERHRLPLASTSSQADAAAAASALSSALFGANGGSGLLPPVSAAWAYGSGVFLQRDRGNGAPLPRRRGDAGGTPTSVDLLFAVADPREWHSANLDRNPGHYSGLARSVLGPSGIAWMGSELGPGVWFNSGVRVEAGERAASSTLSETVSSTVSQSSFTVKYGVASEEALLGDLERWEELYLAGRLQKPTLRLPQPRPNPPDPPRPLSPSPSFPRRVDDALAANRRAALAAALLLLPPTFSHDRLLSTIVSLSYSGDVRLLASAEDPRKAESIVRGTGRMRLDGLYGLGPSPSCRLARPVLDAAGLVRLCGGESWAQDPRIEARRELVERFLPARVGERVRAGSRRPRPAPSSSSRRYYDSSSSPSPLAAAVRSALASTVRSSSARAALVGLASAGPAGAAAYAWAKLKKGGWGKSK